MRDIPFVQVKDRQEARDIFSDHLVMLCWVRNINNTVYMRYRGELHEIDRGSCAYSSVSGQRWCIAGVWFTEDSIYWMLDNAIAYPFSSDDFMLYQLTWSLSCE